MKMESLRHNLEYTGTHFLLYLDTQNPHFIWKNVLLLDLRLDPDFDLNQFIASVPTESNEINVQFKSLAKVGIYQASIYLRPMFKSLFLPISSHRVLPFLLSFSIWAPAVSFESILYLELPCPLALPSKGVEDSSESPNTIISSTLWNGRELGQEDLCWSSWSRLPSGHCSFKLSNRSNPETQNFSPQPLKSQMNV